MESLVRAYFGQGVQYFSESGQRLRSVATMAPPYAGNAAAKLLREADFWAQEAGGGMHHPALWMTTTPLFQALTARAGI